MVELGYNDEGISKYIVEYHKARALDIEQVIITWVLTQGLGAFKGDILLLKCSGGLRVL